MDLRPWPHRQHEPTNGAMSWCNELRRYRSTIEKHPKDEDIFNLNKKKGGKMILGVIWGARYTATALPRCRDPRVWPA